MCSAHHCLQKVLSLSHYSPKRNASCTERSGVQIHMFLSCLCNSIQLLPPSSDSLYCVMLIAKEVFNCQSHCTVCNFYFNERLNHPFTASLIYMDLIYRHLIQKPAFWKKKKKKALTENSCSKQLRLEVLKLGKKWRCIKNIIY